MDSLAFDTWGVDFGLLDAQGRLLEDPVHYRDQRTAGLVEEAFQSLPAGALYGATGTQILNINSLYQLLALQRQEPQLWEKAHRLLFMPDLFAWALCGAQACETTIASTSQLLDPRSQSWSQQVLSAFHIPPGAVRAPGEKRHRGRGVPGGQGHRRRGPRHPVRRGSYARPGEGHRVPLLRHLEPTGLRAGGARPHGAEPGAGPLQRDWRQWEGELLKEHHRPVAHPARAARQWRREGQEYSYADLERLALEAQPLRSFIDPDAPEFAPPGDIPGRVRDFCRRTGQPVPETVGQVMRCIYESLALKYRFALGQLTQATGKKFSALHVLGGGTKDGLLCRMTAACTGIPVIAGPVEATALGNILIQLKALGQLESIAQGRELIARTEKGHPL